MSVVQKFTEQKSGSGDMQELQELFTATAAANPRQQKPANSNSNSGNEERKNNNKQHAQKKQ